MPLVNLFLLINQKFPLATSAAVADRCSLLSELLTLLAGVMLRGNTRVGSSGSSDRPQRLVPVPRKFLPAGVWHSWPSWSGPMSSDSVFQAREAKRFEMSMMFETGIAY